MKINSIYNPYSYHPNKNRNSKLNFTTFNANKVLESTIRGQENCWKLYRDGVFENFIYSDSELKQLIASFNEIVRKYNLPLTIKLILEFANIRNELKTLIKKIKEKYDIDISIPPKVYRFVGLEEVKKIKAGENLVPQRFNKKFDVTLNPNLNWNAYRITFKPCQKFSILDKSSFIQENLGCGHDLFYHFSSSYSIDDVEKIECIR